MADLREENKTPKTREGSGYLKQLFSSAKTTASTTHSQLKNLTTILVNFVPLDKIDASELQVRTHFDDQELQALAQSIKMHGVLQPVLVVQNGDRYKVIAGERRMRASKLAGLDRIPARVIMTDDKSTHEMALRENLDRVDLHPLEEGEGYLSLIESKAYSSYEAIAKGFGKPKSRITECIGFTKLPETTKQELLRRNYKQRSLLRKLLNSPPETHIETIASYSEGDEINEGEIQAPAGAAAGETAQKVPAPKREPKPFQCTCDDKGIAVPGFRWKAGEGIEKLEGYLVAIENLLAEAKGKHLAR
jgi:ParB family chromosome partitioning protein